jgi:hypothetical protein
MLRSRSRSWIVALAVAAESVILVVARQVRSRRRRCRRKSRPGDVQKVFVIKNVRVAPLAEVLAVFPAAITFSRFGPGTRSSDEE